MSLEANMGKKFRRKFIKKGRPKQQKKKQRTRLKIKYRMLKYQARLKRQQAAASAPVAPVTQDKVLCTSRDLNHLYKNTDAKWLIIELNEDVELEENHEKIEVRIKEICGPDIEYFIPIYSEQVNGKSVCVVLFKGYFFIRSVENLEKTSVSLHDEQIKGPLLYNSCCQYVGSGDINKFKVKLNRLVNDMIPHKGQAVIPRVGVFKNLEGVVLSVDKRKLIARVIFKRASRVVEAPINIINLQVVT